MPEEIMEVPSPDCILSAISQPDPVTLQPVLTRSFAPIPSRVKQLEVEAWNADSKLDFMTAVDWFPHTDIDPDTVAEKAETFVVPPHESHSEMNFMPPTFGRPWCGNGPFLSAPQQIIQQELMSRCRYGTSSMQDEVLRTGNPLAFISGFGVSFRDPLGSFHIEEVPTDMPPCALGSVELDPGAVSSIAHCLRWGHAAAPLQGDCASLRADDSCYTSSSGTIKSWDLNPLSEEVLDAGCEKFSQEQLECSLPQEVMEPEDIVVSFDIPGNGSAPLPDGTWSPEALSARNPCLSTPRLLATEKKESSFSMQTNSGTADSETGSGNYTPVQLERSQLPEVMTPEKAVASSGVLPGKTYSGPWYGCWSAEPSGGLSARTPSPRDVALEELSIPISSPFDLPLSRMSFPSLQHHLDIGDCKTEEQYGHVLPTMRRFACRYPPRASYVSPEERTDYLSCSFCETDSVTEQDSERADRGLSPLSVGSGMFETARLNTSAYEPELEYGRVDTIFSPESLKSGLESPGSEEFMLEMDRAYSTFSPLSMRSGVTGLASAISDSCELNTPCNVVARSEAVGSGREAFPSDTPTSEGSSISFSKFGSRLPALQLPVATTQPELLTITDDDGDIISKMLPSGPVLYF